MLATVGYGPTPSLTVAVLQDVHVAERVADCTLAEFQYRSAHQSCPSPQS